MRRRVAQPTEVEWFERPLTPLQVDLLRLLLETFVTQRAWPNWRWLRAHLGPDAENELRNLPWTGVHEWTWGNEYGYVWVEGRRQSQIAEDATVRLTVAGLSSAGADDLVAGYFEVLAAAVQKSKAFAPSPIELAYPSFSNGDASAAGSQASALVALPIQELLDFEPPFRLSRVNGSTHPAELTWSFSIADRIERYEGVTSIGTYVPAVTKHLVETNTAANTQVPFPVLTSDVPVPVPVSRRGQMIAWFRENTTQGLTTGYKALIGAAVVAVGGAAWAVARGLLG